MWANRNNIRKGDKISWYSKSDSSTLKGLVIGFNHTYYHGFSEYEPIVERDDNHGLIVIPYSIIIEKL